MGGDPVVEALEHLRTLRERVAYLEARVAAKRSLGWETLYDEREGAALRWALEVIGKNSP